MIAVYFIVSDVTTDASPGYTVVYRTGVVCYLLQYQDREKQEASVNDNTRFRDNLKTFLIVEAFRVLIFWVIIWPSPPPPLSALYHYVLNPAPLEPLRKTPPFALIARNSSAAESVTSRVIKTWLLLCSNSSAGFCSVKSDCMPLLMIVVTKTKAFFFSFFRKISTFYILKFPSHSS